MGKRKESFIPGADGKALISLTKKQKRKAAGKCVDCCGMLEPGRSLRCRKCSEKQRQSIRRKIGAVEWQPGMRGRPPLGTEHFATLKHLRRAGESLDRIIHLTSGQRASLLVGLSELRASVEKIPNRPALPEELR